MNRDEAKYILRAFHLSGQDVDDPQFHEALELTRKDPELGAWFAQEQSIDARLSEKFRAFQVPPNLRAQLLAARKIIPVRAWWQRPVWVGAAACFLLALALSGWLLHSADQRRFSEFRTFVADSAAQLDHLDLMSTNLVEVRKWLLDRKAPGDFVVPTDLKGRPSVGCRKFSWKGQPVSLVCFKIDGVGTVHLFVIDHPNLHNAPADANLEFAVSDNGIATASWSNNKFVYVLAGKLEERELRRLLKDASV
jgi:hypothetical protein